MATRITQNAVEVLVSATPLVRVTQNAPEVLVSGTPLVRVTQNAVEVLLRPEPPLVVSQTGLEVARTGDPPLVVSQAGLEVAHAGDPALVVSQMGIEVAWQPPKGTFALDARLVYDDGYPTRKSNWFTVGAHLRKTFADSFAVNAVIARTMPVAGATFTVAAYKAGRFFLDAALGNWFQSPIDAVLKTTFASGGQVTLRPTSDAVSDGTITYSTGSTGWNLVDEVTLDTSDWWVPAYRSDTGFFSFSYLIHRFPETGILSGATISSVAIFGNAQNMGAPAYKVFIVVRNPATGTLYRVLGWDQSYIGGAGLSTTAEGTVTLTTRPWDSQPWTAADVNAISIGASGEYNHSSLTKGRLARLYAIVTWTRGPLVASAVLFRTQGVSPLKTFTANAVIKRTMPLSMPEAGATFGVAYQWGPGGSFTVAGIRKKTISGIPQTFVLATKLAGIFPLDAEIVPRRFWVYAQVGYFFRVDAEIIPLRFVSDAVIRKTFDQASFTAAAVKFKTATGSKAINAVIKKPGQPGSTTAAAWLAGRFSVSAYVSPYFRADAVVLLPGDMLFPLPGFLVEASIALSFRVDAFVQPYFRADARLELGFMVNAVIKRTMGTPTFLPLSYPGTSQTFLGQTANVLSPVVPIDPGDRLVVNTGSPPSDGSSLTAFSVTGILRYDIGVTPGEHSVAAIPGLYYIVSSKGNVYRPSLTGSGSYSDWAVSSLTFTVAAFIQPTFRVDAAIVWHWEFPPGTPALTAAAWKMDRVVSSFKADTWIQPFFIVRAEVVPRHFHMDAWIKCEFRINAWIIRKVTSSLTANAFIRGYFRVNAVRKGTQLKTFTVGAFKTAPHFGTFSIGSWVLAHFSIGASFRLTKYRSFTVAAWRIFKISSSFPVNAYIKTYFYANANVYRPAEFIDPIPSFAADARLVKLIFGDFAVGAYIEGWFRVAAIRRETFEKSTTINAALIWKRSSPGDFDPIRINASITGFQTNAVIRRNDQRFLFNIFALKDMAHPPKTFLVEAEKRDPGAYWDPFTETWLHLHFLVDAHLRVSRSGVLSIAASITEAGTPIRSFPVEAFLFVPGMTGTGEDIWAEAWIALHETTTAFEGFTAKQKIVRNLITEPLSFPGEHSPMGMYGNLTEDNCNILYGPFTPIDLTPVTVTLWEYPFGVDWLDIRSTNEQNGMYGVMPSAPGPHVFWPSYYFEGHYVWVYNQTTPAYNPALTGSGLISFYRDDTVTLSLPAPTLDAWVVGTTGTPFTINAEVIGRTKLRAFAANAEIFGVGETRGALDANATVLADRPYFFLVGAVVEVCHFSLDAVLYHPSFTVDACIPPYFAANAVIKKTISQSPIGPLINAVIWTSIVTRSFPVNAYKSTAKRGSFAVSATIKRTTVDAFIDSFSRTTTSGLGGDWVPIGRHWGGATYFPDASPPYDTVVNGGFARTKAYPSVETTVPYWEPWIRERFSNPYLGFERATFQFDFLTANVWWDSGGAVGTYVLQVGATTFFLQPASNVYGGAGIWLADEFTEPLAPHEIRTIPAPPGFTVHYYGPLFHDLAWTFPIDARIGVFTDPTPPANSFSLDALIDIYPYSTFSELEYCLIDASSGFMLMNYGTSHGGSFEVNGDSKYMPHLRLNKEAWYTIKLELHELSGEIDRYKIWRAGDAEPEAWFDMAIYRHDDGSLRSVQKPWREDLDHLPQGGYVPGSDDQVRGDYYWRPADWRNGSGMWWEGGYLETSSRVAFIHGAWNPGTLTFEAPIARQLVPAGIDNFMVFPDGLHVSFIANAIVCDINGVFPGRIGTATADARVDLIHSLGHFHVEAIVGGPLQRKGRIYLAAYIPVQPKSFLANAVIAPTFTVSSWIGSEGGGMGGFHANAYIRGSAYIIFPADGGPKTDPYGNPPMIGRSFKVKIEAFIPDPIPMGNDTEIERLISLILEAEQELEAMYCAYTHYTPQDSTAKTSPSSYQSHPAPSGSGYTGSSLPNTISQIGYLGAGDIDDCWCVATIWAAKAAGVPDWHVSVTEYRHWARNPDRPGSTGGTLDHVIRGARGCWPNAKVRRYRSTSWDGFISLLKAGWIGSLAVRCSALPLRLQYHYKLLHQVGVAYHNGKYYIADPLAPNGSRPKEITGAEMRKAARGFVGGTICAALIS